MSRRLLLAGLLALAASGGAAAPAKLEQADSELNLEEQSLDSLMAAIDRRVAELDRMNGEIRKFISAYQSGGLDRALIKRREEFYEEFTARQNALVQVMDVFKRKRDAFQLRSTSLTVAHLRRQELPEDSIDVVFQIMKLQAYYTEVRKFRAAQAELMREEALAFTAAQRRRRRALWGAAAAGGGVLIIGAAALWWRRRRSLTP